MHFTIVRVFLAAILVLSSSPAISFDAADNLDVLVASTDSNLGDRVEAVADQLIVSFKEGITASERQAVLAIVGAVETRPLSLLSDSTELISYRSSQPPVELAEILSKLPQVSYAEPNYLISSSATPNDPRFLSGEQWNLQSSFNASTGSRGINADVAWQSGNTGNREKVFVAVLDSAIDVDHPDLSANIWVNDSAKLTDGIDTGSNLPLTISGLNPGASATITVTTSRTGYAPGSGQVSHKSLVNRLANRITFSPPNILTLNQSPFTLVSTASSGLSVLLATQTPSICTVSGNILTLIRAGACRVMATQAGDATYLPASSVVRTITVRR